MNDMDMKVRGKIASTIANVIGTLISIFSGLMILLAIIMPVEGKWEVFWIFFLFLIVGLLVRTLGNRRQKLIRLYYVYQNIFAGDPLGSLELLSERLNTPPAVVKTNIDSMLKLGMFPGAYLDKEGKHLILPGNMPPATPRPQQAPVTLYQCGSCGASNGVPEGREPSVCEYCGSPLSKD